MIEAWWADLRATAPLEVAAVVLGVVYVLLIMRRNRLGWIAGAASSLIYVWLAARAALPMQSALQAYYVIMAVYGWFSWTRNRNVEHGRIHRWPWQRHVLAIVAILVISAISARWLATETQAAWPWLDSLTTWTSLLATWLVARSVLENWLYWIAIDSVTAFLFLQQQHPVTALLFATYWTIAVVGFFRWRRQWRQQNN